MTSILIETLGLLIHPSPFSTCVRRAITIFAYKIGKDFPKNKKVITSIYHIEKVMNLRWSTCKDYTECVGM